MPRGREPKSIVRQRIADILLCLGKAHGYAIYKLYRRCFPSTSLRNIYYHLRKGVDLEEFRIVKAETVIGNYSWGKHAEKVYYALGKRAKPRQLSRIVNALKRNEMAH